MLISWEISFMVFSPRNPEKSITHAIFTRPIKYLTRGQQHSRCSEWLLNKCWPDLSCKYKITPWLWIYSHSLQSIKPICKSHFSNILNIPTLQVVQKSWKILRGSYSALLYSKPAEHLSRAQYKWKRPTH